MMAQLKIIAHTLQHTKITTYQSEKIIKSCIYESAQVIKINNLLEDLMSISLLLRYALETLAICCIVYITPLVSCWLNKNFAHAKQKHLQEHQTMKLVGYAIFASVLIVEPLVSSLLYKSLQDEVSFFSVQVFF